MVSSIDESLISTKTLIVPQLQNNIIKHLENSSNFSGYEIHYEKEQPHQGADSIYTIETLSPDPSHLFPSRELRSHFLVNQEFYSLEIITSLADKNILIKRIIGIIVILLIFLLLGLLWINQALTKKIWQPFYKTLSSLKSYRVDKQPDLKPVVSSVNEFSDLNQAIKILTETNYQAYQSQKEFTENASHEMQSPLAVFQSKLELLMQTSPLSERAGTTITDLASASKRMLRLNKTLLLITKIDNDQFLEKGKFGWSRIL